MVRLGVVEVPNVQALSSIPDRPTSSVLPVPALSFTVTTLPAKSGMIEIGVAAPVTSGVVAPRITCGVVGLAPVAYPTRKYSPPLISTKRTSKR